MNNVLCGWLHNMCIYRSFSVVHKIYWRVLKWILQCVISKSVYFAPGKRILILIVNLALNIFCHISSQVLELKNVYISVSSAKKYTITRVKHIHHICIKNLWISRTEKCNMWTRKLHLTSLPGSETKISCQLSWKLVSLWHHYHQLCDLNTKPQAIMNNH